MASGAITHHPAHDIAHRQAGGRCQDPGGSPPGAIDHLAVTVFDAVDEHEPGAGPIPAALPADPGHQGLVETGHLEEANDIGAQGKGKHRLQGTLHPGPPRQANDIAQPGQDSEIRHLVQDIGTIGGQGAQTLVFLGHGLLQTGHGPGPQEPGEPDLIPELRRPPGRDPDPGHIGGGQAVPALSRRFVAKGELSTLVAAVKPRPVRILPPGGPGGRAVIVGKPRGPVPHPVQGGGEILLIGEIITHDPLPELGLLPVILDLRLALEMVVEMIEQAVIAGQAVEEEIGPQGLHGGGKGHSLQDPAVDQHPVIVTDPAGVLPVGLVFAPRQTDSFDHLLELGRGEAVGEMGQEPDRGHVFRLDPGPVERHPLIGTDMVGTGEIDLIEKDKGVAAVADEIQGIPAQLDGGGVEQGLGHRAHEPPGIHRPIKKPVRKTAHQGPDLPLVEDDHRALDPVGNHEVETRGPVRAVEIPNRGIDQAPRSEAGLEAGHVPGPGPAPALALVGGQGRGHVHETGGVDDPAIGAPPPPTHRKAVVVRRRDPAADEIAGRRRAAAVHPLAADRRHRRRIIALQADSDLREPAAQGFLGPALEVVVDGGEDPDPGSGDIVDAVGHQGLLHLGLGQGLAHHVHDRVDTIGHFALAKGDLAAEIVVKLFFGDHAETIHLPEDIGGAFLRVAAGGAGGGGIFFHKGIVIIRAFDTAGDKGALDQGEFFGRFGKIIARRHPQAAAVAADIELVGIEFEDLFLGVTVLEAQGVEELLELGPQGAALALEEVFGRLLGEGAAPLHHPAGTDIGPHGAHDAGDVHPAMGKEIVVLGGDNGVDKGGRDS